MRIFTITAVFLLASCSHIESFNDWADSVMPRQEDFGGGSEVVYQNTNPTPSYSQPANPSNLRPEQPNPMAPGGMFNSPSYQDPYAASRQPTSVPYSPPVNNLPPVQQGAGAMPMPPERDYWDHSIPPPPIGF